MFTSKGSLNRSFGIKFCIFVIYGCFLIALSALKTAELFLPYIYQLESVLGGDKLMHLKLSAALSFLALLVFVPKWGSVWGLKVVIRCLLVCLLLIIGLSLDELHQAFTSTRRFEFMDLAHGIAGICIGLVAYWLFVLACRV